jgi:imidazolonepropionase-like amidohydrolase
VPKMLLTPAGLLGDAVASTLDGAALMIAAGAASLAAGVPITVMPAPLLAAGGLAMYLDTDALRDYLLFVAGTLGTGESLVVQQDRRQAAVLIAIRLACNLSK